MSRLPDASRRPQATSAHTLTFRAGNTPGMQPTWCQPGVGHSMRDEPVTTARQHRPVCSNDLGERRPPALCHTLGREQWPSHLEPHPFLPGWPRERQRWPRSPSQDPDITEGKGGRGLASGLCGPPGHRRSEAQDGSATPAHADPLREPLHPSSPSAPPHSSESLLAGRATLSFRPHDRANVKCGRRWALVSTGRSRHRGWGS